jgi:hypothetical protein
VPIDWFRYRRAGCDSSRQIEHVKFILGMAQQMREVLESFASFRRRDFPPQPIVQCSPSLRNVPLYATRTLDTAPPPPSKPG